MSKVDDLLQAGIIIQDPEREDRIIFNVPIYIKKIAVEAGGFEMFAMAEGWTPTIKDPSWSSAIEDENGVPIPNPEPQQELPNPIGLYDECQRIIWRWVSESFSEALEKEATRQSEEAKKQIDAATREQLEVQKAALL